MTEMKILPVERAIEWIRAWTELDWPITWETAYATRDKLGWVPNPDNGRFFTTELSINQNGGYLTRLHNQCSGASIPLTSRNTSGAADYGWQAKVWEFYDDCVNNLRLMYGPGVQTGSRDKIVKTQWVLSNHVTLSVLGSFGGVNAVVKSPEITKINRRELHYIDKYGEDYVDN